MVEGKYVVMKVSKTRLKKRPDVLMEASDITGELKLSMQIIATMDQELQRTGHCYLRKENRFRELITLFTKKI